MIVLLGVSTALDVALTWTTWNTYRVASDYYAGESGVNDADMYSADSITSTVSAFYLLAFAAAGVVLIVWLWRARLNAEMRRATPHRRGRGWVIGSWFCPVVNLWFPFMIVDDVYRASRPTNVPDLFDLRSTPGSPLLGLWWALLLGSSLLVWIAFFPG